ncbi:cell wall anchor protein [Micromonospora vulcania]|uniref:cell wall anchor protein n=1 Tax=Micromonospora vulcania TaxID=1441873 RepID=UPI00366BE306
MTGAAAVLVVVSATPVPAVPAKDLKVYANNALVAPGGPANSISLYGITEGRGDDYTVTVDRSKVSGIAQVRNSSTDVCTESGAILTCKHPDEPDDASYLNLVSVSVQAKDDARPGQEGELLFTVTDDATSSSTSFRSTVSIGAGVDLVAQEAVDLTGAPGATFETPLRMENRGAKATEGVVLFVVASDGLVPTKRYRNCEYTNEGWFELAFACHFDVTLDPGAAVRLDSGFGFRVPDDTFAPSGHIANARWRTPADWEAFKSATNSNDDRWQKGTEGELTLDSVALRRVPQTDLTPRDAETLVRVQVTGDQGVDVAALGATVTGEVGAVVPVKIGYLNNGPAAINIGGTGYWVEPKITLPTGVTALKVPESCSIRAGAGTPGVPVYVCFWPDRLSKGDKAEFEFELRIDKADGQPGEVKAAIENGTKDLDATNDSAPIVVTVTPGGGDGSPGGGDGDGDGVGDGDGDGGQAGGDDGSLPITGARAGLIVGVGGVLLALGAAGYLLARRRRTRFVA